MPYDYIHNRLGVQKLCGGWAQAVLYPCPGIFDTKLVRQTASDEMKFTARMQYHLPAICQTAFDVNSVYTRLHIVNFAGLICIKRLILYTHCREMCRNQSQ